jgi:hypothetical protein
VQLTRFHSAAAPPGWLHGLIGVVVVSASPSAALADSTLTMRGAYYKERATRVMQPMLDASFDADEHSTVSAHLLVDAITSASVAAGAEELTDGQDAAFTERRYEAGLAYATERGRGRYLAHARYSYEPDYQSMAVGGRFELSLAEKNFVVGLGTAVSSDQVSNAGAQGPFGPRIEGGLTTALGSLSLSQILGVNSLIGLTYDLSYLTGFQQNPYRSVVTTQGFVAERHPETRVRHAVAASARHFLAATHSTVIASYRVYADDWGVVAHTPELRFIQEVSTVADFTAGYRYYRQGAADFWKARYASGDPAMEPFVTDDVKLSRFTSHGLEAKLGLRGEVFGLGGRWENARGELLLQYIDQNNRFGNAVAAQAALTVPLE